MLRIIDLYQLVSVLTHTRTTVLPTLITGCTPIWTVLAKTMISIVVKGREGHQVSACLRTINWQALSVCTIHLIAWSTFLAQWSSKE